MQNILRKTWNSPHAADLPQGGGFPIIMGILNVSDDSFSDGGKYVDVAKSVEHAKKMISEGAAIIDIGAESTRPNATPIFAQDEIERLLPHVDAIRKSFPNITISVDTYKPEVATVAIESGADIINDVLVKIEDGAYPMAKVSKKKNCPLVITHNSRDEKFCGAFFSHFMNGMKERLNMALNEGLSKEKIILDPGFGFGKTVEQNFETVARLDELRELGCAILLGVSRKSSLSQIVGDDFDRRDDATSAISVFSALKKSADILRVHNVAKNVDTLKTIAAISKWTK